MEKTFDLSLRFDSDAKDEIGSTPRMLNRLLAKFHGTISELHALVERAAAAAEQVARLSEQTKEGM